MRDALALFGTEVRRCLARRLVWVLVAIALVGIVATSLILFFSTADDSDGLAERERIVQDCARFGTANRIDAEQRCRAQISPEAFDTRIRLTELWPEGRDEGERALAPSMIFLVIGALVGGASMVGADWRFGTMSTLLTWEPRRVRLATARFTAVFLLAFAIGLALQLLLVGGMLPAFFAHGITEGADAGWVRALAAGMVRMQLLVGMAALLGAAVSMLGRNTAAALGAAFAYMVVGENFVRAWRPWLRPWLLAENAYIFLAGYTPADIGIGRGFGAAALTLPAYSVGLAALAVVVFRRRDIAGS
ncbi:MAG: hypothetical protein KY443_10910 [Actinobacteria bacterium]|nr:hypothetical protein [Actinomycetota bacterium]